MAAASALPAPFVWRPATAADVPALAAIYRHAAHRFGPFVYSPGQVAAWAGFASDEEGFRDYVLGADTWLAQRVDDASILGFCGVARAGEPREVRSLYVLAEATRQGLG